MTTSRRTTLKLGAAAIVAGPSVIFSRTASAGVVQDAVAYKAGKFAVKVAGVYDEVPGVISVDLGSINFSQKIKAADYSGIKLVLASGSGEKLTDKFAPAFTKKISTAGLKISVSLLASDGKTPSLTYHAIKAQPFSLETNKIGDQTLWYKFATLQVVAHKHDVERFKLPSTALKVEIEGLGTTSVKSMSKAVYDWKALSMSKAVYDGASVKSTKHKLEGTELKLESSMLKIDGGKIESQVSVTSFVTDAAIHIKYGAAASMQKVQTGPKGGSSKFQDIHFSKAVLTSIQFPNLTVGSDALVTQTLTFTVDPTQG